MELDAATADLEHKLLEDTRAAPSSAALCL
jgi:hypothetical protein